MYDGRHWGVVRRAMICNFRRARNSGVTGLEPEAIVKTVYNCPCCTVYNCTVYNYIIKIPLEGRLENKNKLFLMPMLLNIVSLDPPYTHMRRHMTMKLFGV